MLKQRDFSTVQLVCGLLLSAGLIHCGPGGGAAGGDVVVTPVDVPTAIGDSAMPTSLAGAACTDNSMCGPSLQCNTELTSPGFCTKMCMNDLPNPETAACGGVNSTCTSTLGFTTNPYSMCTNRCAVNTPNSGCRAGFVCTGFYDTGTGRPDTAGCVPFCASDANCPAGKRCNTRTGRCGATGVNMAGLADGELCVLPMPGQPDPCRGECLVEASVMRVGTCGSYINLKLTQTCPDTPERIVIANSRSYDDRGVCTYRGCSAELCCGAGQKCLTTGHGITGNVCVPMETLDQGVPPIPCGRGDAGVDGGRDSGVAVDASADGG